MTKPTYDKVLGPSMWTYAYIYACTIAPWRIFRYELHVILPKL